MVEHMIQARRRVIARGTWVVHPWHQLELAQTIIPLTSLRRDEVVFGPTCRDRGRSLMLLHCHSVHGYGGSINRRSRPLPSDIYSILRGACMIKQEQLRRDSRAGKGGHLRCRLLSGRAFLFWYTFIVGQYNTCRMPGAALAMTDCHRGGGEPRPGQEQFDAYTSSRLQTATSAAMTRETASPSRQRSESAAPQLQPQNRRIAAW